MATAHIKRAKNKEFYGAVFADNKKEIWRTSETYKRKISVRKAISGYLADMKVVDETVTK